MELKTITLSVDASLARLYEQASPEMQRKVQIVFEVLMRELFAPDEQTASEGLRMSLPPLVLRQTASQDVRTFDNDEDGYLQWVAANPEGFVLNTTRSGRYAKLHKATCGLISTDQWTNYTTNEYIKVCSLDKRELSDWGKNHSSDFSLCGLCNPKLL